MNIKLSRKAHFKTQVHLVIQEQSKIIKEFSGTYKEFIIHCVGSQQKVYVGLGKEKNVTPEIIRQSIATGVNAALGIKKEYVSCVLPKLKTMGSEEIAFAMAESLVMTAYRFDKYKTSIKWIKMLKSAEIVGTGVTKETLERSTTIAEGTCFTRNLVNELAHVMTPAQLAEEAKELGKAPNCQITILDEKKIKKEGLGLLQAVGQSGPYPPRLILMEYKGDVSSKEFKAVVGKGITFDTGGLNLKSSGSIEGMRQDMAGAAVALGVFKTVAALELKVNVVCVVGAAYNAIEGTSYIPGDIYKSYLGKTVQIKNTDAEGRLVLADALAYVNEKYNPTCIVNLATLTGAIVASFGDIVAGLFSNDDQLAADLFQAGEATFERLWRLPVYEEYSRAMKGDLADLNNLSNLGRGHAGSITAAAFLKEFVGKTPWAHLDIAGTAFNDKEAKGYVPKYGTGFGVRLIVEWLNEGVSSV